MNRNGLGRGGSTASRRCLVSYRRLSTIRGMRTHGWSGSAPATDEEAISRILDAASKAIDARGADFSISDVARTLGVTRQTVYRYFPSTDALLIAAAVHAASGFLDRLAAHLRGITDPADAIAEAVATALEWLPEDKFLGLLIMPGRAESAHRVDDLGCRAGFRPLDGSQVRRRLGGTRVQRRRSRRTGRTPAAGHPVFRHRPWPPAAPGRELRRYLRRWVGLAADPSRRSRWKSDEISHTPCSRREPTIRPPSAEATSAPRTPTTRHR